MFEQETIIEQAFETSSVCIVISRKAAVSSCYEVGMAVCIPRKRTNLEDTIRWSLQYYSFLDDKRSLNNIDSILNRLVQLEVVHICCTESALPGKSNTGLAQQRCKEVAAILSKIGELVDSYGNPTDERQQQVSHILSCMPKPMSSLQNSNDYLDSTLPLILEEESLLQYRNDKSMTDLSKRALGVLVHESGNNSSDEGTYSLLPGDLSSHLSLDRIAMECINLLPNKKEANSSNGPSSIYEVLNKCQTKMGSSLLQTWCRQPLIDLEQINQRHDLVEFLLQDGVTMDILRSTLKGIANLDDLIQKILTKSTRRQGLQQIYRLYTFVDQTLPLLVQALPQQSNTQLLADYTSGLTTVLNMCANFQSLVEEVLDLDLAPEQFLVKSSFSEELSDLKRDLNQLELDAEELHAQMNAAWNEVSDGQVRLEVTNNEDSAANASSWSFRLNDRNHEKILREKFKGVVEVHKILKNGVYFSTKELKELGTEKTMLLETYQDKQAHIVQNVMEVAETYLPLFEKSSLIVAQLDVLASFAYVAAHSPVPYVRPEMTDEDDLDDLGIVLEEGRHPVVELQEGLSFIPNNFDLRYGTSNFLIITGPNMGGKSTYIRALAAIVTMSQIGSFVPCSKAKINIMHSILARVGAGDAQHRGISTFMAEMLEASSILSRATKRSLIVIDELGRGTSTFDGFGLAWAISEYIATKLKSLTVFATHFHELTRLEDVVQGVTNKHVTAVSTGKRGSLTFLYEVQPGPCLESFGIQVAEMANFPSSVIEDAKQKAAELENFHPKKKAKLFKEHFCRLPLGDMTDPVEKIEAVRQLLLQS